MAGDPNPLVPHTDSKDGVTPSVNTLTEQQKDVYDLLQGLLDGGEGDDGSLRWMFDGLQTTLDEIRDDFEDSLPGSDLLGGSGAGGGGSLSGSTSGGGFPSKPIKVTPKEKPTIADMMQLPVEFSMGYLLIYNKLDEMQKGKVGGEEDKKKKSGGGIGGFFSNLLKGAEGIALIAVGLIAFAGAMILFQFIQWDPALKGLVAFGIFVVAMVIIAKTLGENMKDFETFAKGVLLMTAGIILFNVAIWISAKIVPYWPAAQQTIIAFGIFVGLMVIVAAVLGKELANFEKFALGVLLMTAAIILFDIAIIITALIQPFVPGAMEGLKLFGYFVAGAAVLAIVLGTLIEPFVLMAVAIILLDVALLLFAWVIKEYSKLLPLIPAATEAIKQSGILLAQIAIVALLAIPLLVPIATLAAALLIIAVSFLLWGAALAVMAALTPLFPLAKKSIEDSLQLLESIAIMAAASIVPIAASIVFGASLIVISVGFILWGGALAIMGAVSKLVPPALAGISQSLVTLQQIGIMALESAGAILAVIVFSVGIAIISVAFMLWGAALAVIGAVSPKIPAAIIGIQSSMAMLKDLGLMFLIGSLLLIPVIAFSAGLVIISLAFVAWAAALSIIGSLSDKVAPAQYAIEQILDTFKLIVSSMDSRTASSVSEFASNLVSIAQGMKSLTDSTSGFTSFTDSLAKLSAVNLADAFKPLLDLTKHQTEIDRLAQALERISKAIQPPRKTIWDVIGNLTGGNVANPGATSGEGVEKKKDLGQQSVTEKLLMDMNNRLADWDPFIKIIANNSGNSSEGGESVTVVSSAGSAVDKYAVHGPIARL